MEVAYSTLLGRPVEIGDKSACFRYLASRSSPPVKETRNQTQLIKLMKTHRLSIRSYVAAYITAVGTAVPPRGIAADIRTGRCWAAYPTELGTYDTMVTSSDEIACDVAEYRDDIGGLQKHAGQAIKANWGSVVDTYTAA